jgi:hypothetical protein
MSLCVTPSLRSQTQVIPDSVIMVTGAKGDTGFVFPIRAAERLSNIRFGLLPEIFSQFADMKKESHLLRDRVANLQQQFAEASGIAERRKQEIDNLNGVLQKSEKELRKKSRALRFFRGTTVTLAIVSATLLIVK